MARRVAVEIGRGLTERNAVKNKLTKLAFGGAVVLATAAANAQSNIDNVITSIDGYQSAAIAVGIGVLLYTLGRKVIRKLF